MPVMFEANSNTLGAVAAGHVKQCNAWLILPVLASRPIQFRTYPTIP